MDILANVLSHANPEKVQVATARLEKLSRSAVQTAGAKQFDTILKNEVKQNVRVESSAVLKKDQSKLPATSNKDVGSVNTQKDDPKRKAMLGLETVLATKFVEGMMPKDQSRLYGEGTAGDIWRGLHIETLGKSLASRGLFNISGDNPSNSRTENESVKRKKAIVPFAG